MKHLFLKTGFQKHLSSAKENNMEFQPPDLRYEYFLQEIVRTNFAWCLFDGEKDTVTLDYQNHIHICIFPSEEAAKKFGELSPEEISIPHKVSLKEFLGKAQQLAAEPMYYFAVYPTEKDLWIVSPQELLNDLEDTQMELMPIKRRNCHDCKG